MAVKKTLQNRPLTRASLHDADKSEPVKRTEDKRTTSGQSAIVHQCEGQRLLCERDGTSAHIAEIIGESRQRVSEWRAGLKKPSIGPRAAMQDKLGIPASAWSMLPTVQGGSPVEYPKTSGGPVTLGSSLEEANALLIVIKGALAQPGLGSAEQMKLSDTMSRVLTLRSKLERENELLESRIVYEHPAWKRLKAEIFDALQPFPEAMHAVAAAMREPTT